MLAKSCKMVVNYLNINTFDFFAKNRVVLYVLFAI